MEWKEVEEWMLKKMKKAAEIPNRSNAFHISTRALLDMGYSLEEIRKNVDSFCEKMNMKHTKIKFNPDYACNRIRIWPNREQEIKNGLR